MIQIIGNIDLFNDPNDFTVLINKVFFTSRLYDSFFYNVMTGFSIHFMNSIIVVFISKEKA